MPFRSKGRSVWKTRFYLPDDRGGSHTCGTSDYATACAIEEMIRTLKRRLQWKALELVVLKRTTLADLYVAYESNALPPFIQRFEQLDLSPILGEWDGHPKYKTQIRKFIPEGKRFGAEQFTKRNISLFLKGLVGKRGKKAYPISGSTRIRYRAALSVFANYLVEIEAIPHNPVRDVAAAKPNAPRIVWLERGQAQALIGALSGAQRACEALMAACGVEWQVITRLRRRDIDLEACTVHAQGGKTPWRNRVVRPTEEWAWEIFAEYARDFTDNALIFEGLRHSAALRTHKRIGKSLGLPVTTLHDWRHSYAVWSLKAGYSAQVIAHQLGHRDSYLVLTRYGRHVPDALDYERHATAQAFG